MATLQVLIGTRMAEREWSYSDLERRSRGALTKGRWQQLAKGVDLRRLPAPDSIMVIAEVLEVEPTTVLLAAAASVGIPVRRTGSILAHLLPTGTEMLSQRTQDAVLNMLRAVVSDAVDAQRRIDEAEGRSEPGNGPRGLRALGDQ
ncbi:hypothetical protein [Pseudonocardia pini]|uniref:hypothetical protein n=1 Tax=Pseudonocardia pini TaxID=2758030 RepID=UPI0015F08B6C|nr:hypothetical protein [Pseudonocardia pini]